MLLAILTSHVGINPLSRERTSSNNNSCKVRALLRNKRGKKNNQDKKDGNAYQADEIRNQNDNSSNIYQVNSAIAFASMATISLSIHSLFPKPSVIVP